MSSSLPDTVSQLINLCNKDKPLSESDIEVVRLLISAGADVNAVGSARKLCFMRARFFKDFFTAVCCFSLISATEGLKERR